MRRIIWGIIRRRWWLCAAAPVLSAAFGVLIPWLEADDTLRGTAIGPKDPEFIRDIVAAAPFVPLLLAAVTGFAAVGDLVGAAVRDESAADERASRRIELLADGGGIAAGHDRADFRGWGGAPGPFRAARSAGRRGRDGGGHRFMFKHGILFLCLGTARPGVERPPVIKPAEPSRC